jgi:hypothetical protein
MPRKKITDKNLHLRNLNGHKKIHLREAEKLHCCLRGIRIYSEQIGDWIRGDDIINAVKVAAVAMPEVLPDSLQAIEWELSKVVEEAALVLKDAAEAIELCHSLRAGNATLCKLIKLRQEALAS